MTAIESLPDAVEAGHRRVLAELDVLLEQVAELILSFEASGLSQGMRDDYVKLHDLQHRMQQQHREHRLALGLADPAPALGWRH